MIASTPAPPYYAVIFTTIRQANNEGYAAMAEKMDSLAREQPGYLGHESAHSGVGITISYWRSLHDIAQWKQHSEHVIARDLGRQKWYKAYRLRVCLVERDYGFWADDHASR